MRMDLLWVESHCSPARVSSRFLGRSSLARSSSYEFTLFTAGGGLRLFTFPLAVTIILFLLTIPNQAQAGPIYTCHGGPNPESCANGDPQKYGYSCTLTSSDPDMGYYEYDCYYKGGSTGGGTDTGTGLTATIKYSLNGGTGSFANQTASSATAGSYAFTLRKGKPTPPTGKNFLGWSLSPYSISATPPVLQPGDQLIVQYGATITLYAMYGTPSDDSNCVVQMPTTGAPEGTNVLAAGSIGVAATGLAMLLRRRKNSF
ncbi:hypothetical protein DF196_01910 [Bifidobacterium callitrichidarum]|uniref:Uncharacterized protein n=1 Tax=Bifidobacterium callitrichidarum TaxID=2052941 RepID=A0A2U2NC36_9BIFI|nr:hypothetical protein DF196_01910 [Bifidobacterium callitrichidarum]